MAVPILKTILAEGRFYTFTVTGRIILPDNTEQFVLVDPNGIKHLIDAEPYDRYSLLRRKEIQCHVDKINCSGKIYLEPEHPVYKTGRTYSFEFAGFDRGKKLAVFNDALGYYTNVPISSVPASLTKGERLDCLVLRIKRGRVYISYDVVAENYNGYTPGQVYSFTLTGEVKRWEKYEFYTITDEQTGRTFHLRKKFYRSYGFKTGSKILCTLKQVDNQLFFEPQHPTYTIGEDYLFDILREEPIVEYPNQQKPAYFLRNDYGKEIIVKKEDITNEQINGGRIKLRVIDIVKSRVIVI